jgi:hypothetical protein
VRDAAIRGGLSPLSGTISRNQKNKKIKEARQELNRRRIIRIKFM